MRRYSFFIGLVIALPLLAQSNDQVLNYRRNALATMLVFHPEDEFGRNIYEAFDSLPLPDKYDDQNIGLRIIDNSLIVGVQRNDTGFYKATYGHPLTTIEIQKNALAIENLLNKANVGQRLVSKWFNFQGESLDDAFFDTQLIQERGQYNASDVDVAVAMQTVRGVAALADAGEELISQTFVLVNDITYVTAEQEAEVAKATLSVLGSIVDALFGGDTGKNLASTAGAIADSFTGFKVKTHSYLYQLDWNDSIANIFYTQYYTSKPDTTKISAYLENSALFRVRYVAHEYEFDKKSTLKGVYERSELVKTICARSMDKNIVALAKQYEDFKVKTPVYSVLYNDNGKIKGYTAKIGMKEGISEKSKFQVVQRVIDTKTEKTTYKYVATVKPIKGKVWDNRYNAVIEQGQGSDLSYTTFKKTSGGEILPGMLLIEGKYRKITK